MRYVVDASVAAKWLLPEEHTEQAELLLANGALLFAPDLLYAEVANVLWRRVLRGEVAEETADDGLALLLQIEIATTPAQAIVTQAFAIACRFERTVYDATYLALALEEDAVLVTSDKRLCNALRGTALKSHIRWIGDVASS